MNDTLVLNKNYLAIHIIGWQKAMSLLYQGHADVVDEDYRTYTFDDWAELSSAMDEDPTGFVHTPTLTLKVPEIIRLTRYEKLPKTEVKFTRRNLYEHYKNTCCYCAKVFKSQNLNLDHIIPRSKGGKTDWSNIVTSCIPCNQRKDNKLPQEVGMKLKILPTKPRWRGPLSVLKFSSPIKIRKSWQKVIDSIYWDSELEKK